MRSAKATKTFNWLLAISGICLISLSWPKLDRQTQGSSGPEGRRTAGVIVKTSNDARIKKSHLFHWTEIGEGEKLHADDMLFTNKDSTASFTVQGQRASIKEETLVKIKADALEIKEGKVELTLKGRGSKLDIVSRGRRFALSAGVPTTLTVQAQEGFSLFKVASGKARIRGDQTDLSPRAGEEARIFSSGRASKARVSAKPLYPVSQEVLLSDAEDILFRAEGTKEEDLVFIKNLASGKTGRHPVNARISLEPGDYEWSLIRQGEKIFHAARFSVSERLPTPQLKRPKHLEQIVYYGPKTDIEFEWNAPSGVLEVIDRQKNIHYAGGGTSPRRVEFLNEGLFQWRVRRREEKARSPWSEPRSLLVARMDYELGEAVVIELKKPDQLVEFEWDSVPGAKTVFELSKTANFKQILVSENVRGSKFKTIVGSPGIYYWRIKSAEGNETRFIPVKAIVRPTPPPGKPAAPPKLKLKLRSQEPATSFNFSSLPRAVFQALLPSAWAQNGGEVSVTVPPIGDAKIYEFEIYADAELKRLVKTVESDEPGFVWSPPRTGSYTWRLRYRDFWGRWSPWSDPSSLAVEGPSVFGKKKRTVLKKPVIKKTAKNIAPKSKPKPKPKLKPKPKKKAVEAKSFKNSFAAYYAPAWIDYKSETTPRTRVQGAALGGHAFVYERQGRWRASLEYRSNYGQVFAGQDFSSRSLRFALSKHLDAFGLRAGPSLLWRSLSTFKPKDSEAVAAGTFSRVLPGLKASSQIKLGAFNSFCLEASVHALNAFQTSAFLSWRYSWNNKLIWETKLGGEYLNGEANSRELGSQSFQLFTGPRFLF